MKTSKSQLGPRPPSGRAALLLPLCGLLSCDSLRTDPPPVQPSSEQAATGVVHIGSAQPFAPGCMIVETGATIEWRNLTPRTSISVVSVATSPELSSPALRDPYNTVTPEKSDECVLRDSSGCLATIAFSFWRHTFTKAGIFDYRDASGGGSTATTVGEYGMPSGPQQSGSAATGTVCVRANSSSTECDRVCCTGTIAGECGPLLSCVSGRCGGVTQ